MDDVVVVDRRFRGPPDSGNGGYVAGLLAAPLGRSGATVTLTRPPPLGVPLRRERAGDVVRLLDGEVVIGTATRSDVVVAVPPPPTMADAEAAAARFTGLRHHIFPDCFVCGPERPAGDGLRIFAGAAGEQVASSWRPDGNLADERGLVRPEFLWAALDCPGYFAAEAAAGLAVLGRMEAAIHVDVAPATRLVVTGWALGSEGRKHRVGTALHDEAGRLVAAATAIWVTLRGAAS